MPRKPPGQDTSSGDALCDVDSHSGTGRKKDNRHPRTAPTQPSSDEPTEVLQLGTGWPSHFRFHGGGSKDEAAEQVDDHQKFTTFLSLGKERPWTERFRAEPDSEEQRLSEEWRGETEGSGDTPVDDTFEDRADETEEGRGPGTASSQQLEGTREGVSRAGLQSRKKRRRPTRIGPVDQETSRARRPPENRQKNAKRMPGEARNDEQRTPLDNSIRRLRAREGRQGRGQGDVRRTARRMDAPPPTTRQGPIDAKEFRRTDRKGGGEVTQPLGPLEAGPQEVDGARTSNPSTVSNLPVVISPTMALNQGSPPATSTEKTGRKRWMGEKRTSKRRLRETGRRLGHGHSHSGTVGRENSHGDADPIPMEDSSLGRRRGFSLTAYPSEDVNWAVNKQRNINVRAAFVHVVGDLVQSMGVLIAALVYKYTGNKIADPICTFVFSVLVMITTITVLRDAVHVLMEGTPKDVDYNQVRLDLQQIDGVETAHSLHMWSLTMDKAALAVHLAIGWHVLLIPFLV